MIKYYRLPTAFDVRADNYLETRFLPMISAILATKSGNAQKEELAALRDIARDIARSEGRMPGTNVMRTVDQFLNLGSTKDITLSNLNPQERTEFLRILSALLKKGIVGYRDYEVDGRIERHHVLEAMVNRRLRNARTIGQTGSSAGLRP